MHPDAGLVAVEELDTGLFQYGDDLAQRVRPRAYRPVKALDALDGAEGDYCFCGQRLLAPSKKGARGANVTSVNDDQRMKLTRKSR